MTTYWYNSILNSYVVFVYTLVDYQVSAVICYIWFLIIPIFIFNERNQMVDLYRCLFLKQYEGLPFCERYEFKVLTDDAVSFH